MSEETSNTNKSKPDETKDKIKQQDQNNDNPLSKEKEESRDNNSEKNTDEYERRLHYLQTFRRKRDFFSFYSKKRNTIATTPINIDEINIKGINLNNETNQQNAKSKKFIKSDLRPRGFGISKVKEKIDFFEKSMLVKEYPINILSYIQKKYYPHTRRSTFDMKSIKPNRIKMVAFNLDGNQDNNEEELNFQSDIEDKINKNKDNNVNYDINNDINIDDDKDNKKNYIIQNINNKIEINISNQQNQENNNTRKTFRNFIVDYSKIINSSKINKKQQIFDNFLKPRKEKKEPIHIDNNINIIKNTKKELKKQNNELFLPLSSLKEGENSKKYPSSTNPKKKIKINHDRQKSDYYYYKDLINKISQTEKRNIMNLGLNQVIKESHMFEPKTEVKNNKYMLVKKRNNKISVEKKRKFEDDDIKKVFYDNIADNVALDRLDRAKNKLNKTNNNNVIKNQIYEILDKLVIDGYSNKIIKKENEQNKLNRAVEIMPQLLVIKQKLNLLLMNNEENNINIFNEKNIKTSVSSIYFLECIGLEPNILFDDKENIHDIKFVNDVNENIQLNGINNKKKYLKYYFKNINKANLFLEILIDSINKTQLNDEVENSN